MKCDYCGKETRKMKQRRNFPHGKKSKSITTRICKSCETNKEENEK